jgi:DNA replication protein DnaC
MEGESFKWAIQFLEKRGRECYGDNFRIDAIDHPTIYALLVYFLRYEPEATRLGINLGKGLLLLGPIGCGKTSLMALIKRSVSMPGQDYTIRSCREITFEFMREDFGVITRYSNMSFENGAPKTYCFDDLGSENTLQQYGNSCNVMGEIIQSRYDLFVSCRMITHITTNLHANGIEHVYGDRIRSRMREMFNLISFDKNTRDKRV